MEFAEGMEFLCGQGAVLAMLPMERWLRELEHAEAVGAILDPTLYRKYLWSGREGMTKDILRAAIEFKHAIQRAQQDVSDGKVR